MFPNFNIRTRFAGEQPPTQRPRIEPQAPLEGMADDVPDLLLLEELERDFYDLLNADGIEERGDLDSLSEIVDLTADTEDVVTVEELGPTDAVMLNSISNDYALCARGWRTDGTCLAGMTLVTEASHAQERVDELLELMEEQGAYLPSVGLFIVGGEVNLIQSNEPEPEPEDGGSIALGGLLIEAAGDRLESARIGVTQTDASYPLDAGESWIQASAGRPGSVDVYMTQDAVFYVPDAAEAQPAQLVVHLPFPAMTA